MKIILESSDKGGPGEPGQCKGRYFRYIESGFAGKSGRLVITQELRPLKRISCPGCPVCDSLADDLRDGAGVNGFLQFDGRLTSGDTVYLAPVPVAFDHETGQLEEWYYEVRALPGVKAK